MALLVSLLLLALLGTPAWGAVYYISTSGNDSNSCSAAQSTTTPKRTVGNALGCLGAGDTLYLRSGTYSCGTCLSGMGGGNGESVRKVIAGYPSDGNRPATITISGSSHAVELQALTSSYITFANLRFDARGTGAAAFKITCGSSSTDYSHHIRFSNVEIFGAGSQGILANAGQCNADNQGFNEVLNAWVHDNGADPQLEHGLYFASSDNLVDGADIGPNAGCGIHVYSSSGPPAASRNIIRNTKAHGHTGSCGVGILVGSGDDHLIYNNVTYDNNGGIMVGNGGSGTRVYNNTVANNLQWCLVDNNDNTTLRNNICYGNGSNGIAGSGSGQVASNNLLGSPNPLFVNAGARDYHLQGGSPAIGTGVDLSSVFTTDFDGNARTLPFDQGAYEYGTAPPPPPSNAQLAWWKCDEGAGSTCPDSSGQGQTLTLTGSATWAPGRVGPFSLSIPGAPGQATAPVSFTLTAYTWALWVWGTNAPQTNSFQFVHRNGTDDQFMLAWSHPVAGFSQAALHRELDGTYQAVQVPVPLLAQTWYHLAATYDGSSVRLYLNGSLQATRTVAGIYGPVSGAFQVSPLDDFLGRVDDLRVYNYALSAAAVQALYGGPGRITRHAGSVR